MIDILVRDRRQARRFIRHFRQRWLKPVAEIKSPRRSYAAYKSFLADWRQYAALPHAEALHFADSYPCLFDRTITTPFDAHYFYQNIWAFKHICTAGSQAHVDVGSQAIFAGMLSAITSVVFVDIRPLIARLENFVSLSGSILSLPFDNNSIGSLSCLHVAEHIGLGRYGDPLDPQGTVKAARELARVLAPGGRLYFSLPIGQSRLCFNAHRIHDPAQILQYFPQLDLMQFAVVNDRGRFISEAEPGDYRDASYACGMFCFGKPKL